MGDTQPGGEKGEGEEVKGEVEREEEEEEKQEEEEKAIDSGRGEGDDRSEFSSNLPLARINVTIFKSLKVVTSFEISWHLRKTSDF